MLRALLNTVKADLRLDFSGNTVPFAGGFEVPHDEGLALLGDRKLAIAEDPLSVLSARIYLAELLRMGCAN